jgi:hypothetical protein
MNAARHDGQFSKLLDGTKIYIEIENIQEVNKYDPFKKLTFLKLLMEKRGASILHTIDIRP